MRLGMLKKLRPETREAARAAARRSGRSVEEWLNTVVAQSAASAELDAALFGDDDDADVQERLDELSRRIDRLARQNPAPAPLKTTSDTDALAKVIARLDRRLDHFVQFAHSLPSTAGSAQPAGVDRAVAEITARQRALRGEAPVPPAMVPQPGMYPAPMPPMPQAPMPQMPMHQAPMHQAPMHQAPTHQAPMPRTAPQHPAAAAIPAIPSSVFAPAGAPSVFAPAGAPSVFAPAGAPSVFAPAGAPSAFAPTATPPQMLAAQVDAQYAHAAGYASPAAAPQPAQQPAPRPAYAAPVSPPRPQYRAYTSPRMQPQPPAPQMPPPAPDLSRLENQLRAITEQIETLRKPGVEDAISALRAELKQIAQALTEALPRQVIDAVEAQIQTLTHRLSEGRQAGVGETILISIEQHLGEVRDALRQLTPAEHLIGFNDTVEALAQRIDEIVAQRDPVSFHQFEDAVNNLRTVSAHIASSDAVSQLVSQVQALASKVDQVAYTSSGDAALAHLEQRISALADAISTRNQNGSAVPQHLEKLVGSLSDKLEQIQASRGDGLAFSQLEDRIVRLAEKLDASDSRFANLEAVERGLADLLVQTENQRNHPSPHDSTVEHVDVLRLDVARTQDSLEAVHSTLGILVDRLAAIESGIRERAEAPAASPVHPYLPPAPTLQQPIDAMVGQVITAATQLQAHASPPMGLDAAIPQASHLLPTDAPPLAPVQVQPVSPPRPPQPPRRNRPIDPDLPPDHPIEPGMARAGGARGGSDLDSPAARIAASEAALGAAKPPVIADPGGRSDFIAAARRAARAAEQIPATHRHDSQPEGGASSRRLLNALQPATVLAVLRPKLKSLLIASSVVAIVVGGYYLIGSMLGDKTSGVAPLPTNFMGNRKPASEPPPGLYEDLEPEREQGTDAPAPEKHSSFRMLAPDSTMQNAPGLGSAIAATPAKQHDVTGAINPNARVVYPEILPEAIGSANLRDAALRGDAGAAYEVAARYAEGRGVPHNSEEAVRWFDRAAQKGVAVAQFRLGSMYEKGNGVRRDLKEARRFYKSAADQGHAKAMHNLAVLYAEGIDGKPDYNAAFQLFQKAADYGVRDSQYNLGILYARGLGASKDLSASYKWFSLAAAQGDKEAAKKRDELNNHLDAATRASAETATKAWAPHLQPQQAIRVPTPPNGWGQTTSAAAAKSTEGQVNDWTKTLANEWARTQAGNETADMSPDMPGDTPNSASSDKAAKATSRSPAKPRRQSAHTTQGPLQLTAQ